MGGEFAATCTSDVSIRSVSIDRNGRQGIATACANGIVIDRVKILHSHTTAIDLEPNGDGSNTENIEISNSYLNARITSVASAGTYDISNVSMHDNIVGGWDPSYPWLCVCGPSSSHRHDWRVWNNRTLRGSEDISTVKFTNVRNVRFSGNTSNSSGKNPVPSVKLVNVTGMIKITDNTLQGAAARIRRIPRRQQSKRAEIGSMVGRARRLVNPPRNTITKPTDRYLTSREPGGRGRLPGLASQSNA